MDRLMVYPGAIPLDTDILSVERNVMEALGWLTQAALGAATGVVGLPCNPTVPASMTVNIGPGALWTQAEIDQSNFGSLPADTSPLMKMGILPEAAGTNFTLTAPATSGQSINYLIEAAFEETDTNPVVLPYVNPANPAQPFTGPNNAGTPQNTMRAQRVELQLKAGVAANTGTQVTPGVDAGYVGLYVITVNFGQTTITSADITLYENAPFIGGPFAELAGNTKQPFYVGPATQPTQAVQLGQVSTVISSAVSGLAEESWVEQNYAPIAGNTDQPFSIGPATQPTQAAQLGQVQSAIQPYNFLLNGLAHDAPAITDCNAAPLGYSGYNANCANAPTTGYGILYQFSSAGTVSLAYNWVTQIAYDTSSPFPFMRNNINDSGWSAWQQLASEAWVKGAFLPLGGGTLTGALAIQSSDGTNVSVLYSDNGTINSGNDLVVRTGPEGDRQYFIMRGDGQFCPSLPASMDTAAPQWGQVQSWAKQQIENSVLTPATYYGGSTNSNGSSTSISFTAPCNGQIVINGSGLCTGNTNSLWFSATNGTHGGCPISTTVQGGSGYVTPVAIINGIFEVAAGAQVYIQLSIAGGGGTEVGFIWKFYPTT